MSPGCGVDRGLRRYGIDQRTLAIDEVPAECFPKRGTVQSVRSLKGCCLCFRPVHAENAVTCQGQLLRIAGITGVHRNYEMSQFRRLQPQLEIPQRKSHANSHASWAAGNLDR